MSIHSSTAPPAISVKQIDPVVEQHALDEVVRERADHRRRQEREQHADDEAPRRRIGEKADRQLPQPHEIDRQQRQDRAELDQHREGLAEILVGEAEEVLDQQQVAGRRDRQELGQALDDAEDDRLDEVEGHAMLRGKCGGLAARRIDPCLSPNRSVGAMAMV